MKTSSFAVIALLSLLMVVACSTTKQTARELPRIAIAGLGIESSTFSPAVTHEEAFHPRIGDTILTSYRFLRPDSAMYRRAEWFPILIGRALPGGIVTREAYESLAGKIVEGLKKDLPYDGLFFDIHGAMSVEGLDVILKAISSKE